MYEGRADVTWTVPLAYFSLTAAVTDAGIKRAYVVLNAAMQPHRQAHTQFLHVVETCKKMIDGRNFDGAAAVARMFSGDLPLEVACLFEQCPMPHNAMHHPLSLYATGQVRTGIDVGRNATLAWVRVGGFVSQSGFITLMRY